MGVVSLPRAFVFRLNMNDPHPMPWIRVMLSAAIGEALYPHPQWRRLCAVWERFYPRRGLTADVQRLLDRLLASMPSFVSLLINHRPKKLRGHALRDVVNIGERQPARLVSLYRHWLSHPEEMYRAAPSLVLAVLGQARSDMALRPEDESTLLAKLLTFWALRATVDMTDACAAGARIRAVAA